MNVYDYWKAVLTQDAANMRKYFHASAYINWHNTNEHFTLEEFIRANCEYPDKWDGEVERVEEIGDLIISVTHVYDVNQTVSFHAISFFQIKNGRIVSIDEYWGDDGRGAAVAAGQKDWNPDSTADII